MRSDETGVVQDAASKLDGQPNCAGYPSALPAFELVNFVVRQVVSR